MHAYIGKLCTTPTDCTHFIKGRQFKVQINGTFIVFGKWMYSRVPSISTTYAFINIHITGIHTEIKGSFTKARFPVHSFTLNILS